MIKLPLDFLWIPLVGLIPIIAGLYEAKKEKKFTIKSKWELFVGVIVIFLSLNDTLNDRISLSTINTDVKNLLAQRKIDSINNAMFQKYLKDTFGIVSQNNKPVVYNTKIYNSQIQKTTPEGLSDSTNYIFKLKNDTISLSPKQGVWNHAYIALDAEYSGAMLFEGMGTANELDKINIDGKIFKTHLNQIYERAVFPNNPMHVVVSTYKSYIIFGDEGVPTKRYILKNGKVKWIPESTN